MHKFILLITLLSYLLCVESSRSVVYINRLNSWSPEGIPASIGVPGSATNSSYNVFNLAFWLSTGPVDSAEVWSNALHYTGTTNNPWGNTTQAIQSAWVRRYHSYGIKILVSAFGATEFPTTAGIDPVQCGTNLANFVLLNNLDGVDLDYEDSGALERGTGEAWLISITRTLRQRLPKEQGYIITHAPQSPYFMGAPKYPRGGYMNVHNEVGDLIDFYNIQFYNQGTSTYDTYETLFRTSNGWASRTAVKELISKGIPANKIIVGKPVTPSDADNTGYISLSQFSQILRTATADGWNSGFMGWQYTSDSDGNWSKTLSRALNNFHE
jgi:chitinase